MTRKALLQQAQQAYNARRFDQVEAIGRDLLTKRPRDLDALRLLAQVALDRGLNDEAAAYLVRCVDAAPRDANLWLWLGQTWLKAGHFKQAAEGFERAGRLRPGLVAAKTGHAGVLERQRQRGEALALLEPIVAGSREDAEMASLYGRLQVQEGSLDRAIEVLERHRDDPDAPPGVLRMLHFALGDALEKTERYDEAFAAYERANSLLKPPFDPGRATARTQRLIEVYSRAALERLVRATNDDERPILIVGMPRSGTTLVERIIAAHPAAHGGGELDFMPRIADTLAERIGSSEGWPQCVGDLDAGDADRLAADYLGDLGALAPEAKRIVDKQLGNDQALGLASLLLPAARVIWCRRDPMDTCFSCYTQALAPMLHPYASDLAWLGVQSGLVESLMTHWQETLDNPWLTVSYEAIVEDHEGVARSIIDFCGLPWDERCLHHDRTADHAHTLSYDQVRRPIYTTSVGRAARFAKHLGPLRDALR